MSKKYIKKYIKIDIGDIIIDHNGEVGLIISKYKDFPTVQQYDSFMKFRLESHFIIKFPKLMVDLKRPARYIASEIQNSTWKLIKKNEKKN